MKATFMARTHLSSNQIIANDLFVAASYDRGD